MSYSGDPRTPDRLEAIQQSRDLIGGIVTVLDVSEHGNKQANAVDLVWSEVPWLVQQVRDLQAQVVDAKSLWPKAAMETLHRQQAELVEAQARISQLQNERDEPDAWDILCAETQRENGMLKAKLQQAEAQPDGWDWFFCPECQQRRRFEYKMHLDEFAGECGHRLAGKDAYDQEATEQAPANHEASEVGESHDSSCEQAPEANSDRGASMVTRNWHAIIGPNGMCECGVRSDGTVVHCADLLCAEERQLQELLARCTQAEQERDNFVQQCGDWQIAANEFEQQLRTEREVHRQEVENLRAERNLLSSELLEEQNQHHWTRDYLKGADQQSTEARSQLSRLVAQQQQLVEKWEIWRDDLYARKPQLQEYLNIGDTVDQCIEELASLSPGADPQRGV